MKTLLRIDASPKRTNSYTRNLSDHFVENWLKANPDSKVIVRDLASTLIPHLNEETINDYYGLSNVENSEYETNIELSDMLVSELISADEIVIASPLYNLMVPSSLKAYIDYTVREGKTFIRTDSGLKGVLDSKGYVITAKGGVMKGTELEKYDFQEPYLTSVLSFMGVAIEGVFSLEGTSNAAIIESNELKTKQAISNYFNN